jgi:putative ABC transport system permease protein
MLWKKILFSLRHLKKYKSYTFINILGLALALVPVLLTIIYINNEFSFDKYNANYKNIYRVAVYEKMVGEYKTSSITPDPLAAALKMEFPEIISSIQLRRFNEVITFNNKKYIENNVYYTDPDFFKMFTVEMILGNQATALSNPNAALISRSTAKKYFGSVNPLNRTFLVDETKEVIIKGVYKDIPNASHFKADFIINKRLISGQGSALAGIKPGEVSWGFSMFMTYVLVNPKTDINDLNAKIPQFLKKYSNKEQFNDSYVYFQPLSDIHLYSKNDFELSKNGDIKTVYLYGAIAFIILLIAIINYINLATGRLARRSKETAMKKIIGAGKPELIINIFLETLFLTCISFLIALILTLIVLHPFADFVERDLSFAFMFDLNFLGAVALLITFISVSASIYPAYIIASVKPLNVFRNGLTGANSKFRNTLVVVQFVLAISLIFITTVIKEQLNYVLKMDLGFDRDNIIVIQRGRYNSDVSIEAVKNEIEKNPNITSVSISSGMPNRLAYKTYFSWEGKQTDDYFYMASSFIDEYFIDLYGMKIVEGRNFSKDFPSDLKNGIILNETAVRSIGLTNPIGKYIYDGQKEKKEIIGVVKDFNTSSLHNSIEPYFFIMKNSGYDLSIKIKPGTEKEVVAFLKDKIKTLKLDFPLECEIFADIINAGYKEEQNLFTLFSGFSIFSIIVAAIGLFGLVSFTSEARKKEIGIRKVTGASSHQVAYVLFKEIMRLIIISSIISAPIAYYSMQKWLNNFAYKTGVNFGVFLISALVVYIVAVSAMAFQVYRAARQNPVDVLKCE